MRTTLDLPDGLLRRAKVEATRRGQSLRELVAEALRRVLEIPRGPSAEPATPRLLRFPLFDSIEPGALGNLTQSDLDREESDHDLRRSKQGREGS